MKVLAGGVMALVLGAMLSGQSRPSDAKAACDGLAALVLTAATIERAELVPAGGFTPPGEGSGGTAFRGLPSFCRVAATLKPSSDSNIRFEVWMPAAGWNGKFQAVGNGAFNGTINYAAMRTALARGYATSSTDTGHTGGGARWALGHPEKVVDFGWRAVHEMTLASKRVIERHYGSGPTFSYWTGCSAGGRQGMKAAQRFPEDFDGIIAGAPGLDWTSRAAQAARVARVLESRPDARLLEPHRQLLHGAVVAACDALDGVKDGLIEDPQRCTFEPATLECTGASGPACLTRAQIETARLMYSTPVNLRTGRTIPGLVPGSELGWTDLGWSASARATALDQFRFIVFRDPDWTLERFEFEADVVRAEQVDRDTINALDANLKRFFDRGGKLLQYHGWSDPQISPLNSTQYYARVVEALGGTSAVHDSYRLFMAPGMAHCGGGAGPNTFEAVAALERWVERGQAPDQIVASHAVGGVVDRTRPLCPYPQVAAYAGTGSPDEAAHFACRAPSSRDER
jgi:feruloyl esterase